MINFGDRELDKSVVAWTWGWFLNDLIEELERSNFDLNREGELTLKSPRPPHDNFCNIISRWAKSKNGGRRPLSTLNTAPDASFFGAGVRKLAQGIAEDEAFDRLPILADALEEASCTDTDILTHLRGPGPHYRGCHVVDLLLNRGEAR